MRWFLLLKLKRHVQKLFGFEFSLSFDIWEVTNGHTGTLTGSKSFGQKAFGRDPLRGP